MLTNLTRCRRWDAGGCEQVSTAPTSLLMTASRASSCGKTLTPSIATWPLVNPTSLASPGVTSRTRSKQVPTTWGRWDGRQRLQPLAMKIGGERRGGGRRVCDDRPRYFYRESPCVRCRQAQEICNALRAEDNIVNNIPVGPYNLSLGDLP